MKRADILTSILCVAIFTAVANIVVLIPVLTAIARDFHVSEARVGQLAAVHALVAAGVALMAAPLTDRFPRRLVLRVECAILVAGTLISATAQSFVWLAAGRIVAGMGAALIIPTCLAIVADLYPNEIQCNRRLGTVASSAALATVIGLPILTQVATHANWHWSIAVIGVPTALVGLGTWLLPVGVTRAEVVEANTEVSRWAAYIGRYRAVVGERATACLLGIQFVLATVIGGLWLYFAAWAQLDFVASAGALSALFLLSGLCELVTSNITPRLLECVPTQMAFVAEAAVLSGCLLGVGVVFTREWMLAPFVLLVSLAGIGLFFINTVLLIDAQPAVLGTVMSLQAACSELGWAGGAALGGVTLAVTESYAALYRALGLFLLLAIALLALRSRALVAGPESLAAEMGEP